MSQDIRITRLLTLDLALILDISTKHQNNNTAILADCIRDKVRRLVSKYEEVKVNNEEFQNLVVKELD